MDVATDVISLRRWILRERARNHISPCVISLLEAADRLKIDRHITVINSLLIITDYNWKSKSLIIHPLHVTAEDAVVVKDSPWPLGDLKIIGIWPKTNNQYVICAYVITSGLEADVLLMDTTIGNDFRRIASWDMSQHGLRSMTFYGKHMIWPHFDTDIDQRAGKLLLSGPSTTVTSSWGTEILDLYTLKPQMITIDGFRWSACSRFHPKHPNMLVLVCCRRPEFVENFARPNTSGTLIVYDTELAKTHIVFTHCSVSSEVLKFNRNGDILVVRSCERKEMLILDSTRLVVLKSIAHDISSFTPNHFAFTTLYQLFPVFSICDSYIIVLQWQSYHNGARNEACLATFNTPTILKRLCELCKFVVLRYTRNDSVHRLPVPKTIQQFISSVL